MPTKNFKVYTFNVSTSDEGTPLTHAVETARGCSTADREKTVRGKIRRLDRCDQRDGAYLLNFVGFDFAGPGRVRRGQPVNHMGMAADEHFADDTAMLYAPQQNLALIETSAKSVSPGAIGRLLCKVCVPSDGIHVRP